MEDSKRNQEPEAADNAGGDEYGYSSAHRKTNNPSMDVNNNEAIELRKSKVLDLDSKGYTQDDIAEELGISQPTVSRDLKEAHDSIAKSRTGYVQQALRDYERKKLGQNKVLKRQLMFITFWIKLIAMRFIIRAQIPTEAGNRMMQNPSGMQQIEAYMQSVKAEAAYFFEAGGDRTMVFVVNMDRTDQMAVFAEPLFMMGAKVEFHPVMLLEDLKKAGQSMKR